MLCDVVAVGIVNSQPAFFLRVSDSNVKYPVTAAEAFPPHPQGAEQSLTSKLLTFTQEEGGSGSLLVTSNIRNVDSIAS